MVSINWVSFWLQSVTKGQQNPLNSTSEQAGNSANRTPTNNASKTKNDDQINSTSTNVRCCKSIQTLRVSEWIPLFTNCTDNKLLADTRYNHSKCHSCCNYWLSWPLFKTRQYFYGILTLIIEVNYHKVSTAKRLPFTSKLSSPFISHAL